jgi:hypothetical protein
MLNSSPITILYFFVSKEINEIGFLEEFFDEQAKKQTHWTIRIIEINTNLLVYRILFFKVVLFINECFFIL